MIEANNDHVICPGCCHQFRAIPVSVQDELAALRAQLEQAQAEIGQLPEIQAMLMTENKKMRGALMIAAAALKHSSPNRESVNALEQHNAAIDVIITALETKT